jgi:hypothetical protein
MVVSRLREGVLLLGLPLLIAAQCLVVFVTDLSKSYHDPASNDAAPPTTTEKTKMGHLLPEIVQRSLHALQDDRQSNVAAAVCHKSLFGDVDLWMVLDWVAYHRLLGFDRIFISYVSSVKGRPGFYELASLPYVTLKENKEARVSVINDRGYQRLMMDLPKRNRAQVSRRMRGDWPGTGCTVTVGGKMPRRRSSRL